MQVREPDLHAELRRLWKQARGSLRALSFTWSVLTLTIIILAWLVRHLQRGKLVHRNRTAAGAQLEPIESARELAQLLRRLDVYWAQCGVMRPAHRAPLEHLETIPTEKLSPDIRRAGRRLIQTYYLTSFGGVDLPKEELRKLQREFDCLTHLP